MIEDHLEWAATLLKVTDLVERVSVMPFEAACRALEQYKETAHKEGRKLLGTYHPDKDPENADRYKALNQVLQNIKLLKMVAPPRVVYTITFYPPTHPAGGAATSSGPTYYTDTLFGEVRTVRGYDARRAANLKPDRE